MLEIDGGEDALLAAGFEKEAVEGQGDVGDLALPVSIPDVTATKLETAASQIQKHAETRSAEEFRRVRDEKIAKEKADEAKLNEHGGFSRGRHNLQS